MFYIKSDDIDDLFREAAEKYHVDTEKAEAWEDVQAAVHAYDTPPLPPAPQDKGKKRRWFVLCWLLLVPLGWFAHNIWSAITAPGAKPATTVVAQGSRQNEADQGVNKKQAAGDKIGTDIPKAVATVPGNDKAGKNKNTPVNGGNTQFVKQGSAFMHTKTPAAGYNLNARPGGAAPRPGLLNSSNAVGFKNGNGGNNITVGIATGKSTGEDKTATAQQNLPVPQHGGGVQVNNGILNDSMPVNGPGKSPASYSGTYAARRTMPNKAGKKEHYFYAGLTAAPDVSLIHFQKPSAMGVGAGILLGYQLNKHLSIESGALIDKKYYYTNGEYFDISKVHYFAVNNIHPESVTGNCDMVEIPLNLRYTFKTKSPGSFYVLGGISSYLMGRQAYTFNYKEWGVQQQSTWDYNTKANYWLSVLNVGAGYQRALGKNTNLRIEPYAKLPLSGLGTGNLKIASAGLYITLTRKIPW